MHVRLASAIGATFGLFVVIQYEVLPAVGVASPFFSLASAKLRDAEDAFRAADFSLTPDALRDSLAAAEGAPLESSPFYYAAFSHDENSRPSKIIALLDETIRRNPRHNFARMWRARMYFRTGQPDLAARELSQLLVLDQGHEQLYIDALVDLAADPAGRNALLGILQTSPPWASAFERRAADTGVRDDFLAAVAARSKSSFGVYVQKLMADEDFERAFLVWQSKLDAAELLAFSWPFDPLFNRPGDAGAFGWQINSALAHRADDGLDVFYSGFERKTVASQVVLLGLGYTYRLEATVSGAIEDLGGFFSLRLACRKGDNTLGEIKIHDAGEDRAILSTTFVLPPETCPVQILYIEAHPGERLKRARLNLHQVRIVEVTTSPASQGIADGAPEPNLKERLQ